MSVDLAALDALITKLRTARSFLQRAAPVAAQAMLGALQATADAGTTPRGQSWPARAKDGGRALAKASAAITVRAVGTFLLARLAFPETIHNAGTTRIPRRQILPSGEMPPAVAEALKNSLIASWEEQ